jgi:hypothetical protein
VAIFVAAVVRRSDPRGSTALRLLKKDVERGRRRDAEIFPLEFTFWRALLPEPHGRRYESGRHAVGGSGGRKVRPWRKREAKRK